MSCLIARSQHYVGLESGINVTTAKLLFLFIAHNLFDVV